MFNNYWKTSSRSRISHTRWYQIRVWYQRNSYWQKMELGYKLRPAHKLWLLSEVLW